MKWGIWSWKLTVEPVLTLQGSVHEYREGLLIGKADDCGQIRIGEISPLPGFSKTPLGEHFDTITNWLNHQTSFDLSLYPAIQMGLDMLELKPNPSVIILLNGLLLSLLDYNTVQ